MEEKVLLQLKKEIRVSKIINIASLLINACLLCALVFVSIKAMGIADTAMAKVEKMQPAIEKVSTIDTASINEAVAKLNKTIEKVDWDMVSDKLAQLDVDTINAKIRKLDVDMIQDKLKELDIKTLNKKINEMDMEEFSKAAENMNKIVARFKGLGF